MYLALHDSHAGVGGSEIDSDDFTGSTLRTAPRTSADLSGTAGSQWSRRAIRCTQPNNYNDRIANYTKLPLCTHDTTQTGSAWSQSAMTQG